jgi:hypothetical protein
VDGASVNPGRCARRIATTVFTVDAKIMLRVLVVILRSDPIVTSRRFLRQRNVTLVYLGGSSLDTLPGTMSVYAIA